MTRILICGSRQGVSGSCVYFYLDSRFSDGGPIEVVTGGALGVDRYAADWAAIRGHSSTIFHANWKGHGKAAGPMRNRRMLDYRPDEVIAFWDGSSPGTKDTITEARKRGVKVTTVAPPDLVEGMEAEVRP